jgi:hypothetical protein
MDKISRQISREVVKNSSKSIRKQESNLAANRSYKTFSETAPQNDGKDTISTKASEPNSALSKVERLRKEFYRNNTSRTMASETLKMYQEQRRQSEHIRHKLEPILSEQERNEVYPPGSPAAFDPRLTSLLEASKTLHQEQTQLKQATQQDHWVPNPDGGHWRPANELPKPAEKVDQPNKQEPHWRPSADGGNWKPA